MAKPTNQTDVPNPTNQTDVPNARPMMIGDRWRFLASETDVPNADLWRFLTSDVLPGQSILDVGCGYGEFMILLTDLGGRVSGIEIDLNLVNYCRGLGLDVQEGFAEELPFQDSSFDRIVCGGVLPFTDERKAVAEWERVIKPGGRIFATYLGLGYGLHEAFMGANYKRRIYGAVCWRIPIGIGLWAAGCQASSETPFARARTGFGPTYRTLGLVLEQEIISGTVAGLPRYICHRLAELCPLRIIAEMTLPSAVYP